MNRLIWFTIISVFFIILIVPAFLAYQLDMIPSNNQPGYDGRNKRSIYGEKIFKQYFLSPSNNLTAIGTSIKNPNLKNKKDIFFKLYDEKGWIMRELALSGQSIGDGDFVKFIFDPVKDSLNKKFYFILSSPNAGIEEIIEVFLVEETPEVLEYSYGKESGGGGAPIVVFYKPDRRLDNIKFVYSNLFSKFLRQNFRIF